MVEEEDWWLPVRGCWADRLGRGVAVFLIIGVPLYVILAPLVHGG